MDESVIEANAVLEDGLCRVRIRISGDSIESVEKLPGSTTGNVILFPGFIDVHVHAREYALPSDASETQKAAWEKMTAKESFRTAGRAAINGGVVLYAAMPNDPIPPDNEQTYNLKKSVATTSECPVILLACITRDSEPWANLPYKLYLDHKSSASSFSYWKDVNSTLARYRGRHVFFHAEDPIILEKNSNFTERWKSRPPEAETSAVSKILDLTSKYSLKTHICHISTIQAVKLIEDFNLKSSTGVTCEVTPHHLFFSVDDSGVKADGAVVNSNRSFFDCNPPLRCEHDRTSLIEALRDGVIDMVAGDHAPHTSDDKVNGAPGMPQLDTYGAFAAWLIRKRQFSLDKIAQVFSKAPASLLSEYTQGSYGSLREGATASMTFLDLAGKTLVNERVVSDRGPLGTKCAWSPFDGMELPGAVYKVIVNGRVAQASDIFRFPSAQ
ncbi:MAG: amidohydrolase family protein [Desulfomonilaceae bacterium]